MTTFEIAKKAKKHREIQAMIRELEREADVIKKELTDAMDDMNVDIIHTDIFTLRWKMHTSSRVDTKALKKELPDIADRYTVKTEVKRFQIA